MTDFDWKIALINWYERNLKKMKTYLHRIKIKICFEFKYVCDTMYYIKNTMTFLANKVQSKEAMKNSLKCH